MSNGKLGKRWMIRRFPPGRMPGHSSTAQAVEKCSKAEIAFSLCELKNARMAVFSISLGLARSLGRQRQHHQARLESELQ
jgi:formylmethanofuran dehydrogenase subunit B